VRLRPFDVKKAVDVTHWRLRPAPQTPAACSPAGRALPRAARA
jgi:hypothetical protein